MGIRATDELPAILFESHLRERRRREIQCVDQETMCLSQDQGWIPHTEIRKNETILVFDPATQKTHWEALRDLFVMDDYRGLMYRIGNSGIDALVSPKHRWPVGWKHSDGVITVGEAITEELNTLSAARFLYKAAPHGDFPKVPTYTDEFVRLISWIITEGHIWGRKSSPRICIVQSEVRNAPFVEMIRSDIMAMNADFTHFGPGSNIGPGGMRRREGLFCREYNAKGGLGQGARQFILSGTEVDAFIEVTGHDKAVSYEFLTSLTEDQIRMFTDILIFAEGTKHRSGNFRQHEKATMDFAVAAFVLAGYGTSLFDNDRSVSVRGWQGRRGTKKWFTRPLAIIEEQYDGVIWCPVTYAGHWVARRNGKTYITGNSAEGVVDPAYTRDPKYPGQIPLYNRVHPAGGRKVNSLAARRDSGASFYA